MQLRSIFSGVFVVCSLVACGGAAAAPVHAAPSASASSAPAGACAKLGGRCTPQVATIVCKGEPAADCSEGDFCCVM